jgi:hypothetical protein
MRNQGLASLLPKVTLAFLVACSLLAPAPVHAKSCKAARNDLVEAKKSMRSCLSQRAQERARCNARSNEPCLIRQCPKANLSHASSDVAWFCLKSPVKSDKEGVSQELAESQLLQNQSDARL